MAYKRVEIPAGELSRQREICFEIRERVEASGRRPLALVDTYGCQQNEADSEELRGYIELMGYGFTENEAEADLIVVNTCAVREHAEMRVLGNVGALVHAKAKNPNLLVAVCGCMVQQPHMAEKLKKSFRVVDLAFGPHELWRFPELYKRARETGKRVFAADKDLVFYLNHGRLPMGCHGFMHKSRMGFWAEYIPCVKSSMDK